MIFHYAKEKNMKNAKKIGIALVLVILIAALAVFASIATDSMYTGSLYWLEIHVARFEALGDATAANRAARETAITEIDTYLATNPIDPTEEGYAELAHKVKRAKIDLTKEYITEINNATSSTGKASALKAANKWFETIPFTEEDMEGDEYLQIVADIESVAIPVAEAMLADVDDSKLGDFRVGYYFKVFKGFMDSTEFNEEDPRYEALYTAYAELSAKYDEAVEANKQALYAMAPLEEYGYGMGFNSGFEAGQPVPGGSNVSGTNSLGQSVSTQLVTESETYVKDGVEYTNNYRTMRFSGVKLSTYWTVTYSGAGRGMVFEFDITTKGQLPEGGLILQTRPSEGTNTWFTIDGKGVMKYRNGSSTTGTFDGNDKVIVANAWTHISFIFDPANPNEGKLYIDYSLATDKSGAPIKVMFDQKNWGFTPAQIRIGNVANATGEFSIDNIKFTVGTAHRDDQFIEKMASDLERFLYYGDYLVNEENSVPGRVVAYQRMSEIMNKFGVLDDAATEAAGKNVYKPIDAYAEDEGVIAAITAYNESDAVAIQTEFMRANLVTLQGLVEKIGEIDISPDTVSARSSAINAAVSFISNNQAYILTGQEFDDCQSAIAKAQEQLTLDQNVVSFNANMAAFASGESIIILNSKYAAAKELYELIGQKQAELLYQNSKYESFKDACDIYFNAAIELEDARELRNAKDIIISVNYVLSLYPEEKNWKLYFIEDVNNPGDLNGDGTVNSVDVDLAVQNNKDFSFIDNYLTIIRGIIKDGYDSAYIGVEGAIQRFDAVNGHYFDLLQKKHAEHIGEQLDTLASTQSFITKEGIIAYLKRYKATNDVDVTHAMIAPLQVRMDAYEEELKYQDESYAELLRQNTGYFVNQVKMFDTALTYLEKKALFDAATLYYYEMNATSEELDVAGAIAVYNAMAAELAVVDDASAEFIRNMSLLPASETKDDYYRYLVGAMLVYENIDESIDGVAAAKARYITAYNEYNAKVDATNSEIAETGAALGSLRANCGLSAIISAFIERIFNF